ncbi:MAG: hypothetical protein ACI3XJ_01775 [Oscillospiraceae bacterium]
MTDRETLYKGASYAAWGYLFLYLDINLGTVSILPRFVGWLLFLAAIQRLSSQRRDLALLRPLGIFLAVWNGADWLASWAGADLDGRFPALDLIVGAASLYFHFQFLTDCAALAAEYQPPDHSLDRRLLRLRTVQTLLITAVTLLCYPAVYFGGVWEYAAILLAVAGVLVALCLMAALFALRKLFRDNPETLE